MRIKIACNSWNNLIAAQNARHWYLKINKKKNPNQIYGYIGVFGLIYLISGRDIVFYNDDKPTESVLRASSFEK